MDNRIQAEQPMPRLELDLGDSRPAISPTVPPRVPRWVVIAAGAVAFLFVAFVWPTLHRYEHGSFRGQSVLYRINRITGNAYVVNDHDVEIADQERREERGRGYRGPPTTAKPASMR